MKAKSEKNGHNGIVLKFSREIDTKQQDNTSQQKREKKSTE